MKKIETLGRVLSRNELKDILGGKAPSTSCNCSCEGGKGGSWVYNYEPEGPTIDQDIKTYCSTGVAICGGCSNIGNQ